MHPKQAIRVTSTVRALYVQVARPLNGRSQGDLQAPIDELMPYHWGMADLVFEVVQEADGGYCAECLTENIFTEGDTWQQLRENVLEATTAFFFDQPRPERVRLHLVRDEILSVA